MHRSLVTLLSGRCWNRVPTRSLEQCIVYRSWKHLLITSWQRRSCSIFHTTCTRCHPVLLCCDHDELVESYDSLIHILQGYVSGSIVLVQVFCQDMSKTVMYLTTTPHNKAGTMRIILGLYYKSSIVLAVLARWQHMLEHREDYVTLEP